MKPLARAKLSFTKTYGQMNGLLEGWRQMYVALHTINYRFSFMKMREVGSERKSTELCIYSYFIVHGALPV